MAKRGGGNTTHVGTLFAVSASGDFLDMTPGGVFTDKDLVAIDQAIRHLPIVQQTLEHYAREILKQVGEDDFEIVVSHAKSRIRVYVLPKSSAGIRRELTDSVLLISAMSMQGR
jgi:hypothetical protein